MEYFLIPHPDDETVNMLPSILGANEKRIVFLTNAAPNFDETFFREQGFVSREDYYLKRRAETIRCAKLLGFTDEDIFLSEINDQELYKNLDNSLFELVEFSKTKKPSKVHSLCYEGQHSDHESSRMIAWYFSKLFNAELIEYSNNLVRVDIKNRVVDSNNFIVKKLSNIELDLRKKLIIEVHKSQKLSMQRYNENIYYRVAKNNDYSILFDKLLHMETMKYHFVDKQLMFDEFRKFEEKNG